jgi:hypothetical protein
VSRVARESGPRSRVVLGSSYAARVSRQSLFDNRPALLHPVAGLTVDLRAVSPGGPCREHRSNTGSRAEAHPAAQDRCGSDNPPDGRPGVASDLTRDRAGGRHCLWGVGPIHLVPNTEAIALLTVDGTLSEILMRELVPSSWARMVMSAVAPSPPSAPSLKGIGSHA